MGVKLLTRLRLGLSHLGEKKFKHSFQDTLNPRCSCGKQFETTFHFLLACLNYSDERLTLLSKIRNTNPKILENIILKLPGSFYTEIGISLLRLIS